MTDFSSASLRAQVEANLQQLQSEFRSGADVIHLQQRRSDFFDGVLAQWIAVFAAQNHAPLELACIAIGGYGRRELSPGSDLDVLWLTRDAAGEACAKRILYQLWDAGIQTTGVVRTVHACAELLRHGDIRSQASLLDARYIAGTSTLWRAWQQRAHRIVRAGRWQRRFVAQKVDEQHARRRRFGDTPFFLEPNLKEGEGGLRDWHLIWWIGLATGRVKALADCVARGWMRPSAWEEMASALAWLHRLRWGLHTLAGRKQDRLGFEEQEALAQWIPLDPCGAERNPAECIMRKYYESAAIIRDGCEALFWEWTQTTRHRLRHWLQTLGQSGPCVHTDNVLRIIPHRIRTRRDVTDVFTRVGAESRALDPRSRILLRHVEIPNDQTIAWHPFGRLGSAARMLEEMHRTYWLERFFPEFRPLRYLPQRDAYHCYTVDAHLIEAVRRCEWLLTAPGAEVPPGVEEARAHVAYPEDVLFATLFHDVGKGVGRPHAQVGARLIERAAARLGWDVGRTRVLQFLVRSHQLMTALAFTRDLHDDRLVEQFAETVGTVEQLSQLYLLTIADVLAVGPKVYTEWKRTLLATLFQRALTALRRGGHTDAAIAELRQQLQAATTQALRGEHQALLERWIEAMPERYLRSMTARDIAHHVGMWYEHGDYQVNFVDVIEGGILRLDMLAEDQPGLFAKLCGVLVAHGLNVVEAQAFTGSHGYVIDRFCCEMQGRVSAALRRQMLEELSDVVGARQSVEPLLARRRRGLLQRSVALAPSRVSIDNTISEEYTVVDLRTTDRLGLLYDIAKALYLQNYTLISAKIATIGGQVHDAFYIQDAEGGKVTDDMRIAALTTSLEAVVRG